MKHTKRLILSPCGTSSLTNDTEPALRSLIFRYANAPTVEAVPEEDRAKLEAHIAQSQKKLLEADTQTVARLSAEINTLGRLYAGDMRADKGQEPDVHYLLSTDTWLGRAVAHNIREWLEQRGFTVIVKDDLRGLRPDSLEGFQAAMADLARWCAEEITEYRNAGYHVIFNLTGGFKSIQGFLQTLAMFYADESIYIFETGKELLRLPRLPVQLDEEVHVRKHVDVFRRLFIEGELPATACAGIPETLLLQVDGQAMLSAWGEMSWDKARAAIYREKVLPSPVAQIELAPSFHKSIQKLVPERIAMINQRIDDLAQYLLSGRQKPIRRLDYKALQGDPKPPATHEFDAWADADARRVYCKDEGERIVLIELGAALH